MKISDVEENSTPQKENVLQRSCSCKLLNQFFFPISRFFSNLQKSAKQFEHNRKVRSTNKAVFWNWITFDIFGGLSWFFGLVFVLLRKLLTRKFPVAAGIHNYQKAAPLIYVTLFFWICYLLNLIVGTKTFRAVYDDVGRKLEEITEQKKFVPL